MSDSKEGAKKSGFNFGVWIAFGLMGGAAVGIFVESIALCAGIGLVVGIVIGFLTKSVGSKA